MPSKPILLSALTDLQTSLTKVSKTIQTTKTVLMAPAVFGEDVNDAVRVWAERIEKDIDKFGVESDVSTKYREGLRKLHSLSIKRNQRKSHQRVMKELLADFQSELVQPVMFHGGADPSEAIKQIIAGIPYPDQKGYLEEALRCIEADCKRATAVLGWSAAMHHLHTKIEELGFNAFNTASAGLAKKGGRFKHFKGIAPIESISDLRETQDRVILTILDGMELLESNQRQRLESCLDMRIQASHPGDAEITMPNLESLFSDLSTLVFKNSKLAV